MKNKLKEQLSNEWNKPKEKNLKENDTRTPRDYEKISELQSQISKEKKKL